MLGKLRFFRSFHVKNGVLGVLFLIYPLDVVLVVDKPTQEKPLTLQPDQTIEVTQFIFSGNQAIATSTLERLTNPYLNKLLSQIDLSNIKQRIKLLYTAKGFSQVEVSVQSPKQKGIVEIMITEGKKNPTLK